MASRSKNNNPPTEAQEQKALIRWWRETAPALGFDPRTLIHSANEGRRTWGGANCIRAMGLIAGVPDLFLASPRAGLGGLWIEMKRSQKPSPVSFTQASMLDLLEGQGYAVAVCYGSKAAIETIRAYLTGASIGVRLDKRSDQGELF